MHSRSQVKDQKEMLLDKLQAEGLVGKPTLENCKKLKIKRETRAEVAALDLSNIIESRVRMGKSGGGRG